VCELERECVCSISTYGEVTDLLAASIRRDPRVPAAYSRLACDARAQETKK